MIVGTYLFYATVMVALHPQFIYPFGPDAFDNPDYRQEVVTDRNVAIAMRDGSDDTAVMFFMGNGGALAYFTYSLNAHEASGRTVVAMEYPGGGGIPGKPSEVRLKADALAMYDWLADRHAGPVVVHGYSMGTGLALHVAANRAVDAVLLDAPYVRMCELMTRASWLPACFMPGVQRWDNAKLLGQVTAPILIQHGVADQMIPLRDSERLLARAQAVGIDASLHDIAGGTHNNLAGQPSYAPAIDAFLGAVLKN